MSERTGRVLIVSYRFPPHGGGGVHRIAHFTRHLPDFGWRPRVLTGPRETGRQVLDPSLLELIPDDVEVTRTRYIDGRRLLQLVGRLRLASLTRALTPSFPAMNAGWIPYGISAGAEMLREETIDLIYSSAYPMCSHLVACALKKRFGIPWVADYRDEWSQRRLLDWPTPLHRVAARKIDEVVTANADRVVTTSPAHTRSFSTLFPSPDPQKYRTVTNGFDEERFGPGAPKLSDEERPDGFLICHVGSVFEWRGPEAFLEALRRLTGRGVITPEEIAVRFVGNTPDLELEELEDTGVVRCLDYVPHERAVAWLLAADVLLLINTETTNILAKTFEYLAAGRPILALSRPGPTADLILENDAGPVVGPDDVEGVERALERLHLRWRSGETSRRCVDEVKRKYSRRATTERLAGVFGSVVS